MVSIITAHRIKLRWGCNQGIKYWYNRWNTNSHSQWTYPGLTDKLIDLTRFIDTTKPQKIKEQIINAKLNNKKSIERPLTILKLLNVSMMKSKRAIKTHKCYRNNAKE